VIRKISAQLSYYMGIDQPEQLSDHQFYEKFEQLKWIRRQEKGLYG